MRVQSVSLALAVVIVAVLALLVGASSVSAVEIWREGDTVYFSREASDFPFIWSVVGNNSVDSRPMGCYVDWYVYTDAEAEGVGTASYDLSAGWNPYCFFEQLYFTASDMAGNILTDTLVVDPNPGFNAALFEASPATSPVLPKLNVSLDETSAALIASKLAETSLTVGAVGNVGTDALDAFATIAAFAGGLGILLAFVDLRRRW